MNLVVVMGKWRQMRLYLIAPNKQYFFVINRNFREPGGNQLNKKKMPRRLREFDIIYSNLGNGVNNTGVHREKGLVL